MKELLDADLRGASVYGRVAAAGGAGSGNDQRNQRERTSGRALTAGSGREWDARAGNGAVVERGRHGVLSVCDLLMASYPGRVGGAKRLPLRIAGMRQIGSLRWRFMVVV